jgi:hypothetical protein
VVLRERQQTIVAAALKIQAAAYVSTIQPFISGSDTLSIRTFDNTAFAQHGRALIPIALDYQLDNLYIVYMQRHLKVALANLKKLIFSRTDKREKWYEVFLATFVMLCTLEEIYWSEVAFVQKYAGSVSRVRRPRLPVPEQSTHGTHRTRTSLQTPLSPAAACWKNGSTLRRTCCIIFA